MAESFDDGEFWLPPEFLTDDDILMDRNSGFKKPKDVWVKPLFPFEFPYEFGSFGVSSDLGSPVESVVGSTETESSDEEDYLAGLTRQMAHTTLDHHFGGNNLAFDAKNAKGWFVSGSPQSTLCPVGNGCGCQQGSSRESPNATSHVSSPPATWDLLYAAAGEVARMRMKEEGYGFNSHSRGLLGPPRKPSPVSLPLKNCNPDIGLFSQPSLSYQKLQASKFQQLRQQQMMKQQSSGIWCGQTKGAGLHQQQQSQPGVRNSVKSTGKPLGLSASAWPPLQQAHQQQLQGGAGMRAVFLGASGGKRECAGTGVFLPRRVGTPTETRRTLASSPVLLPAKVVHALNLNMDDMGSNPQFEPRFGGNFNVNNDACSRIRKSYVPAHEKRNLRAQSRMNNEVGLPQEWTY